MMQVPEHRIITFSQLMPQLSVRRQGVPGQVRIWPFGHWSVTVHAAFHWAPCGAWPAVGGAKLAVSAVAKWVATSRAATRKKTLLNERIITDLLLD
jgi:hypothetical protein